MSGSLQAADQAMRAANQKAADAAFQANNRSGVRDSDTVDLHGLYVEEAVSRLKQRLDKAQEEVQRINCCVLQFLFQSNALIRVPFCLRVLPFCHRALYAMLASVVAAAPWCVGHETEPSYKLSKK